MQFVRKNFEESLCSRKKLNGPIHLRNLLSVKVSTSKVYTFFIVK